HAGQARARLAPVERLHHLSSAGRHLRGDAVEAGGAARGHGVGTEGGSVGGIAEESLEQLCGGVLLPSSHVTVTPSRLRARIGPTRATATGTKRASHTTDMQAHTTGAGAIAASRGS